jgi:hypothetical protein
MTEDAQAARSRLARGRLALQRQKHAAMDPQCLASRDSKRQVQNMEATLAGLESYLQSLRNAPH